MNFFGTLVYTDHNGQERHVQGYIEDAHAVLDQQPAPVLAATFFPTPLTLVEMGGHEGFAQERPECLRAPRFDH